MLTERGCLQEIPTDWESFGVLDIGSCLLMGGDLEVAELEITASQRTMSGLIWELTGQPFVLPVMLTGHIRWY